MTEGEEDILQEMNVDQEDAEEIDYFMNPQSED